MTNKLKTHVKVLKGIYANPSTQIYPETLTAWLYACLVFVEFGEMPLDREDMKGDWQKLSKQNIRMLINKCLEFGFMIECYPDGSTEIPPKNERKGNAKNQKHCRACDDDHHRADLHNSRLCILRVASGIFMRSG